MKTLVCFHIFLIVLTSHILIFVIGWAFKYTTIDYSAHSLSAPDHLLASSSTASFDYSLLANLIVSVVLVAVAKVFRNRKKTKNNGCIRVRTHTHLKGPL